MKRDLRASGSNRPLKLLGAKQGDYSAQALILAVGGLPGAPATQSCSDRKRMVGAWLSGEHGVFTERSHLTGKARKNDLHQVFCKNFCVSWLQSRGCPTCNTMIL